MDSFQKVSTLSFIFFTRWFMHIYLKKLLICKSFPNCWRSCNVLRIKVTAISCCKVSTSFAQLSYKVGTKSDDTRLTPFAQTGNYFYRKPNNRTTHFHLNSMNQPYCDECPVEKNENHDEVKKSERGFWERLEEDRKLLCWREREGNLISHCPSQNVHRTV